MLSDSCCPKSPMSDVSEMTEQLVLAPNHHQPRLSPAFRELPCRHAVLSASGVRLGRGPSFVMAGLLHQVRADLRSGLPSSFPPPRGIRVGGRATEQGCLLITSGICFQNPGPTQPVISSHVICIASPLFCRFFQVFNNIHLLPSLIALLLAERFALFA